MAGMGGLSLISWLYESMPLQYYYLVGGIVIVLGAAVAVGDVDNNGAADVIVGQRTHRGLVTRDLPAQRRVPEQPQPLQISDDKMIGRESGFFGNG